jgi:hypothetical protein
MVVEIAIRTGPGARARHTGAAAEVGCRLVGPDPKAAHGRRMGSLAFHFLDRRDSQPIAKLKRRRGLRFAHLVNAE